jgi:hypothetical protein
LGLRSEPQYLRFLNLDQFDWNKASLTARLARMVAHLAEHVKLSWKTTRPIGFVRLIGHTDNTGDEKYNVDLGDRRARAVKAALENILKEDILSGRIRIAILVDPSPGPSAPAADNRTEPGQALNRRVEVFIAPPEPPPPQPLPWPPNPPDPPPPVIGTKPDPYARPPLPKRPVGKSFKQFVDEWLRDRHFPKVLRDQIWGAIVGKDFGLVSALLDSAGISGLEKEAFVGTVRGLAEAPTR